MSAQTFAAFFRAAGAARFGAEYVSPMARALNIGLRTAQRWDAGELEPRDPDAVRAEIRAMLRRDRPLIERELHDRLAAIDALLAEGP